MVGVEIKSYAVANNMSSPAKEGEDAGHLNIPMKLAFIWISSPPFLKMK
jgi:hypothetical protein